MLRSPTLNEDLCVYFYKDKVSLMEEKKSTTSTARVMYENALTLRSQMKSARKAAAALGISGGALADLATPLGPWTLVLGLVFASVAGWTGYVWFGSKKKELDEQLSAGSIDVNGYNDSIASNIFVKAFTYSAIIGIIFFSFYGFNAYAGKGKRGILASKLTPLQKIQNTLFGIQKDVKYIRKGIDRIEKGINKIGNLGGIKANPKSAEDFYHNARVHELGGNRGGARKSYKKYLTFNKKYVDPHLSYLRILKDTEGRSEARRIYRRLVSKYPTNPAVQFVYAKTLEDKPRIAEFQKILGKYPTFLPVMIALSHEYSHQQLGSQTASDRRNQIRYLKIFKKKGGLTNLLSFYLNKKSGEQKLKAAKSILKMYENNPHLKSMHDNPIRVTARELSKGTFQVTIVIMDQSQKIWYKLEGMDDFQDTGSMGVKNPATGKDMPKMFFQTTRLRVGQNKLWVKYQDAKGKINGPVKSMVNIRSALTDAADSFKRFQWSVIALKRVRVRRYRGRAMVIPIWTNNPKIFKSVRYSWDRDSLKKVYIRNGKKVKRYINDRVSRGKHTLYIQGELITGWKTGVLKYKMNLRGRRWYDINPK